MTTITRTAERTTPLGPTDHGHGTTTSWSPKDGGTVTATTPRLNTKILGIGALAGMGIMGGTAVAISRAGRAAKVAAVAADLGATEVIRAGQRAGNRPAMIGVGVATAAMLGTAVLADHFMGSETHRQAMSRSEYRKAELDRTDGEYRGMDHRMTPFVASLAVGLGAGGVAMALAGRMLSNAPTALRIGGQLAAAGATAFGVGSVVHSLFD